MSKLYKSFVFPLLLSALLTNTYSQSNGDTIKIDMGESQVLIINKNATEDWDFELESSSEAENKKTLGFDLLIGSAGYGKVLDNKFFFVDNQENSAVNLYRSLLLSSNLLIKGIQTKNQRFYILPGLGFSYNKYTFNNNVQLVSSSNNSHFVTDSIAQKCSKLAMSSIQIPILFGVRAGKLNKKHLGFQLGLEFSYRLAAKTVVKSLEGNKFQNNRNNHFNTRPLKLAAICRISFGKIGVFANYSITPLFNAGDLSNLHPISCGIIIAAF